MPKYCDTKSVFGSRFELLCKIIALIAGMVLVFMSIITTVSVIGRYFLGSPIAGDLEIIQMLTAVVVSLSFPYCHLCNGNVIVDVFTRHVSVRLKSILDIFGNLLFTILALLLAWQTSIGISDVYYYNNETMMLRLKEWWFYLIISFGFYLLSIASIIVTWRHVLVWRKQLNDK